MSIFGAIALIVGGILLEHNPDWFNGAHTIGTVLFWFGIALVILAVIFTILAGGIFASFKRDFDKF